VRQAAEAGGWNQTSAPVACLLGFFAGLVLGPKNRMTQAAATSFRRQDASKYSLRFSKKRSNYPSEKNLSHVRGKQK